MKGRHQSNRCRGFSLAETALAVGITAAVVIMLLALIPTGLNSMRASGHKMALARMLQAITSDYQMRDWRDTTEKEYFFDVRGGEVANGDQDHLYTARVTTLNAPTLSGDNGENHFLRPLKIRITDSPKYPDVWNENSGRFTTHHAMVAMFDKYVKP